MINICPLSLTLKENLSFDMFDFYFVLRKIFLDGIMGLHSYVPYCSSMSWINER